VRILFVSPYVPSRIRVRPYYWITELAALGHEIWLFALISGPDDVAALDGVRRACAAVTTMALPRWRPAVNCALALLRADPLQLAWSRLPAFGDALRRVRQRVSFDVAHIEHLRAACFAPALRPLPIVYDAVDSIAWLFEQTRRLAPRRRDRWMAALDLRRTARFEADAPGRFTRVVVSSARDAACMGNSSSQTASIVLPNPVDLDYFRPTSAEREPTTILYSGRLSYHANVAAVHDLVTAVMPRVWGVRPDARVLIVGSNPARSVWRFAADRRITVVGSVADLRPSLARATLAACPIRYGAGIQNKVLEAMASGLPVVTTSAAAQALAAHAGRDLVVADSAEAFADEIVRLLAEPARRAALAESGRRYVECHHGGPVLARRLAAVYEAVATGAPADA
jgi:polysaccharide biosynthesis protein PslH